MIKNQSLNLNNYLITTILLITLSLEKIINICNLETHYYIRLLPFKHGKFSYNKLYTSVSDQNY